MGVDAETLKLWQRLSDTQLQSYLQVSIKEVLDEQRHSYVFNMDERGRCVHLTSSNMCNIQQAYDKKYLPESCKQYPVVHVQKLKANLESAHLSCPAIVELILNTETNKLIEHEGGLYKEQGHDVISRLSLTIHEYMKNLFSIDEIYLGLKIYALSTILSELNTMATEATLTTDMLDSRYVVSMDKLSDKWKSWRQESQNDEFNRCRADIENFLQLFDSGLLDKYRIQLDKAFDLKIPHFTLKNLYNWRKEQNIKKHGQLLERYIVVKFINSGFPWNPNQNDHTATFLDCVFPLILCHAVLIAYHKAGREVNETEMNKIIYTVEKLNTQTYDNYQLISAKSILNDLDKYNIVFTLLA